MKLSLSFLVVASLSSAFAFAPAANKKAFVVRNTRVVRNMAEDNPFFASSDGSDSSSTAESKSVDEMTLEEEIQDLVKKEVEKTKLVSKLKTSDGVDYAPWMKISKEDEAKIYQTMKEKATARRLRQQQQQNVSGNLYLDSQAQELSGTGLNSKVMGEDVELEWATSAETNTKGFIIKRRPAKTDDFQVIASFENWGPLASKGPEGGVYRYLDADVGPGGWVYRVSECDTNGNEADICQCLVEVQTEAEAKATFFAAVGIGALGVAAVVAGILLDPMNGY